MKLQVPNFNGLVLALETLFCSAKQMCRLFEKGFGLVDAYLLTPSGEVKGGLWVWFLDKQI